MFGRADGRSRFINRTDPVFDEYTFLHATFQEYFAAAHAATLPAEQLDDFLGRAFFSLSRLIVLEFVAGLGGWISVRCRALAMDWIQQQDRYQQILLRVARVAAAGRWVGETRGSLVERIRAELWEAIRQNHNMALTKRVAEAFAELDAGDLARRARSTSGLDKWAIHCIVDAVPMSVARRERLDSFWREPGEISRGSMPRAGRRKQTVKRSVLHWRTQRWTRTNARRRSSTPA